MDEEKKAFIAALLAHPEREHLVLRFLEQHVQLPESQETRHSTNQ